MLEMDKSTLDLNALHKMSGYAKPPTYEIDRGMGSACFLDPPGYPSYFIQHIYTMHGNSPGRKGQATELIQGRVLMRAEESYEKREAKLRKLWKPLPYNHPRVRAWIVAVYKHMKSCYRHPSYTDKSGKMETLTMYSEHFRMKTFHDDPRFSDEWRVKAQAEVEAWNTEMRSKWEAIAKPGNHMAYLSVREYYPEHEPDIELIENAPEYSEGDWWEVYDHKPSPEECPGTARWGRSGRPHPVNNTWCQLCGWRPAFEEAAVK
jgi:hypothetical protein